MALRPPRAGISVSRRLSERDRAASAHTEAEAPGFAPGNGTGLGGMMGALHSLVGQLSQAATEALAQAKAQQAAGVHGGEDTAEPGRHGSAASGDGGAGRDGSWSSTRRGSARVGEARAVFGYTLRMGLDGVSAEPFGDMPEPRARRAEAHAPAEPAFSARQPIVDVFEEADALVVVAELPGADPAGLVCRSDGRTLLIETSGARRYRKQVALPHAVEAGDLRPSFQNGILEVRLARVATP